MIRLSTAAILVVTAITGCGGTSAPESVGTFTINDKPCSFTTDGRQVEYAVVFDVTGSYSHKRSSTSNGSSRWVEEDFRTSSGKSASIRYNYSGSLSINGKDYPMEKGRVFVVRLANGEVECDQLAITLPSRESPPPDNAYIRGELLKAAEKEPQLGAVFGTKSK